MGPDAMILVCKSDVDEKPHQPYEQKWDAMAIKL